LRKRRSAAVFAASLLAHIGVFAAWFATHPRPLSVEPATMQIELIRPAHRRPAAPAPTPPTSPKPSSDAAEASAQTPAQAPATAAGTPAPAAPTAPPDLAAITPNIVDPRLMTDQELLERAGPRPDLNKVFADEARQPMFSRPLGRNPEDMTLSGCKPFTEHSRRIAPPCPVRKTPGLGPGPVPNAVPGPPVLNPRFADEARAREAITAYKRRYGPAGPPSAADYPGLRCTFLHTHC
jgi:hypothetical protein